MEIILRKLVNFPKKLPSSNANSPIILILGWGGAKPKHLLKLESFYQNHQASVISFIMPMWIPGFVHTFLTKKVAESIESLYNPSLSKTNPTQTPKKLFIHIFSNNGSWVYGSLLKYYFPTEFNKHQPSRMANLPLPNKVIFDSSPYLFYQRMSIFEEANLLTKVLVSTLLNGPNYSHPFLSPIFKSFFMFAIFLSGGILNFQHYFSISSQSPLYLLLDIIRLNHVLRDQALPIPTLFIYSKGDKLVPSQNVQEFQHLISYPSSSSSSTSTRSSNPSLLHRNPVPIQELVFGEDVPHVGSFYKHPEEYKEKVIEFFELKKDIKT